MFEPTNTGVKPVAGPFFELYDSLPNSAEMYLSLPAFTEAGFKALQVKVKQQLLTKENKVAKYRLNINDKEVCMIAFIDDGVLVFIVDIGRNYCRLITSKSLIWHIQNREYEGVGMSSINAALLLIRAVFENTSNPLLRTLTYNPIKAIIKDCEKTGTPITNPLEHYNINWF